LSTFSGATLVKSSLRWLQCAILIFGTAFIAQCGKAPSIDTRGHFTIGSLKGNYTYTISGVLAGGFLYQEAGTFVADGTGRIISGQDDFLQGSLVSQPFVGSYDITSDGAGTLSLTIGNKSVLWAITLATDSQLYLVEFDSYGCGGGGARRQEPSALESLPSGSFAFRTHNSANQGSISKVGVFTTQSNGSLSGMEDVLRQGSLISPSISGSISQPDQNGRGIINFEESTGITSTFRYYVIDPHTMNLLQIDANSLGEGRAEQRTASSFDTASLHGSFAFKSSGDTPASIGGVNSVGSFIADGGGNITGGTYDTVSDGVPSLNNAIDGSYDVQSNGRVSVALNGGPAAIEEVGWLVDSSRGFFLIDSTDRVEDGRFDQQSTTAFANSSLNGQFGFVLSGYDNQTPSPVARLGVIVFDGQGVVSFQDYFVNRAGNTNRKGGFSGTYNVAADGGITVIVPGVTRALIGHLLSPNQGYLLVADQGAEEPGRLEQSTQP
jgi:hypothetical protein